MAGNLKVFLGAENVISPLGWGIQEAFSNAQNGRTGLREVEKPFPGISKLFAAKFDDSSFSTDSPIVEFAGESCQGSLEGLHITHQLEERWLFVLSTTKGDITHLKNGDVERSNPYWLMQQLQKELPFSCEGKVVSCACISGLSALIYAADKIATDQVDHALVVGADLLSEFTALGFESFFAVDAAQCKPFDQHRNGLNLGEAAASVVLSKDKSLFKSAPFQYLGGATSNDANHISGPSRTGEGLYRAVSKALNYSSKPANQVQFISAHGTGTLFNDEMEAKAFSRLGLEKTPLNSLKGYFGHTLGASSLIELAMTMRSMRVGLLLKTFGCVNAGAETELNVLKENLEIDVKLALKTASGFGGCNAAILIEKQ
ncbi:beta-ketoacyl synthase N-terminal-like domain-containing protein [Algoriphagus sp. D3-2-R+10]|uniref:beta-ketoacyl synthase N-terminal-like domain-containing protein n=1 Tax=Algoriphagus aurantiacus TaxID=3103948 RepID=UPI002B3C08B1|nr:beta-ketoacyl synthase N-terminal-like domain-containing protein [Algoriphagus sp. D3-2-R+10]MEB2777810.1 beta-ketoacyl synthase N-terminal-like domain-containing protein [Algoriphagus sp. D3-2-R+10]